MTMPDLEQLLKVFLTEGKGYYSNVPGKIRQRRCLKLPGEKIFKSVIVPWKYYASLVWDGFIYLVEDYEARY